MRGRRDLVRTGAVAVLLAGVFGCTSTPALDAGGCTAGRLKLEGLDQGRPGAAATVVAGALLRAEGSDLDRRCDANRRAGRGSTSGLRLDVVQGTVRQRVAEFDATGGKAVQQFAVPQVLIAGPVDVSITTPKGEVVASAQFELVRGPR